MISWDVTSCNLVESSNALEENCWPLVGATRCWLNKISIAGVIPQGLQDQAYVTLASLT